MLNVIPYEFVFDYLPAGITVRKMFGMHYIYWRKKIMMILRRRLNEPEFNGVWVATNKLHHDSLRKDVPALGPFFWGGNEQSGNWLVIRDGVDAFEEAAIKVCELISHSDPRIGNLTEKAPL
jgi:hypothetical protein